jgi:hypothetical protein
MSDKINRKLIELKLKEFINRFSKKRHIEKDITNFVSLVKKIQENPTLKNDTNFKKLIETGHNKIMDIKQKIKDIKIKDIITKEKIDKLAAERKAKLKKYFNKKRPK